MLHAAVVCRERNRIYRVPSRRGRRGYITDIYLMAIQRALISVSDKTGLEEFAKGLHEFGVELISTGGTAAFLKGLGLTVIEISAYTGETE